MLGWVFGVTVSLALFLVPCLLYAQSSAAISAPSVTDGKAGDQIVALRDAFINKTKADSAPCPLAPPEIVLTDSASFGAYDPDTNVLRTPLWEQLQQEERNIFVHMAGPGATEEQARAIFENGTHHWIIVHEMGHWWQACTHANTGRGNYQIEYDADRIAAAYWREAEPKRMVGLAAAFHHLIANAPSPLLAGETPDTYFNREYLKLTGTPEYTWFQARMIEDVNAERPVPTFAQALVEPRK